MKTGCFCLGIAAFYTTINIKSLYFSSLFIDRFLTKFYTCLPQCVSVCVSVGIVSLGASDENAIVCVLRESVCMWIERGATTISSRRGVLGM